MAIYSLTVWAKGEKVQVECQDKASFDEWFKRLKALYPNNHIDTKVNY